MVVLVERQCYARPVTLDEELDRADALRDGAWNAITGPLTVLDTRSQILLAYTNIALEHQEAIVALVRRGLRGSAVALVRPVFEILYKAAWICPAKSPKR
jgi:hypothetical protein